MCWIILREVGGSQLPIFWYSDFSQQSRLSYDLWCVALHNNNISSSFHLIFQVRIPPETSNLQRSEEHVLSLRGAMLQQDEEIRGNSWFPGDGESAFPDERLGRDAVRRRRRRLWRHPRQRGGYRRGSSVPLIGTSPEILNRIRNRGWISLTKDYDALLPAPQVENKTWHSFDNPVWAWGNILWLIVCGFVLISGWRSASPGRPRPSSASSSPLNSSLLSHEDPTFANTICAHFLHLYKGTVRIQFATVIDIGITVSGRSHH